MATPQLKTLDKAELEEKVRAAQRADEDAMTWLISQTKDRLTRFLYFLSGDAATAQDLMQETYLYALENIRTLKEPGAFLHWLFLIGRNRFLDFKKSPRNRPYEDLEDLHKLGSFGQVKDRELWLQINETLKFLPQEEKEALLLIDLEGHSYGEAAKILGITEAAVTSRLHRARQAFHKNFFKD